MYFPAEKRSNVEENEEKCSEPTVSRIAFDHLIARLEHGIGDFSDRQLFMIGFLSRNDRCI